MNDTTTINTIDPEALIAAGLPEPRGGDEGLTSAGYTIRVGGTWCPVTRTVWRAWCGERMLWGVPWHGPVYALGATEDAQPWSGRRTCPCATCQAHVPHAERPS